MKIAFLIALLRNRNGCVGQKLTKSRLSGGAPAPPPPRAVHEGQGRLVPPPGDLQAGPVGAGGAGGAVARRLGRVRAAPLLLLLRQNRRLLRKQEPKQAFKST